MFCKKIDVLEVGFGGAEHLVGQADRARKTGFLGIEPFLNGVAKALVGIEDHELENVRVKRSDAREYGATVFGYWVQDPERYGVAEFDASGKVIGLEEKPTEPASSLAVTGLYFYDNRIVDIARSLEPSARGELEITDAVQWLIDQGGVVEHRVLNGWWIDTGKKDPLLRCNELVLDTVLPLVDGTVDGQSSLDGPVRVERGAVVVDSTLVGPLIVGSGARVSASTVGPYVSVGANCRISRSTVERSVLMEDSRVDDVGLLTSSVLGREATVDGGEGIDAQPVSVLLGDHSVVSAGR